MITLDPSSLILMILAAALAGALASVMPAWQGMRSRAGLPVWTFLRRRGSTLERAAALQAELRCETCSAKRRCRQLVSEGADTPDAGCPNAALFRGSG
jgi:hypothetical protein